MVAAWADVSLCTACLRSIGKETMTATAGLLLLNNVLPLLSAAISRGVVNSVGTEDMEELVSEGCTIAARMLDSAEAKGKPVTAGKV